jgi:hypothetical protein
LRTLPKMSRGRPINAIMLLRSEVRNDVGRDNVGARDAIGGEPQSSNVCKRPVLTKLGGGFISCDEAQTHQVTRK